MPDRARFLDRRDDRDVAERAQDARKRRQAVGPVAVVIGQENQRHERTYYTTMKDEMTPGYHLSSFKSSRARPVQ